MFAEVDMAKVEELIKQYDPSADANIIQMVIYIQML